MKLSAIPVILLLSLTSAACTQFPELDARPTPEARAAEFPTLLPIEGLIGRDRQPRIDELTQPEIEARIARLRARAATLQKSVIDPNARNRLSQRPLVEDDS